MPVGNSASGEIAAAALSATGAFTIVTIAIAAATSILAIIVYRQIRRLRREGGWRRRRMPVTGLGPVLSIAVLFLGAAVVCASRSGGRIAEGANQLEAFRGEAMTLDERLTMSARLAAATGDPRWEERYREAEVELAGVLRRSDELLDQILGGQGAVARRDVAESSSLNDAMVALEHQCFERFRAGDRDGAMASVMSDEYDVLKSRYRDAVMRSDESISQAIEALTYRAQRWSLAAAVFGVLAAGTMLGGSLLLALALVRHTRALYERNVELVDARSRADVANRSKSEFLANMSHEIRTPLTAILGFADVLEKEDGRLTEAQRSEHLSTIRRAGGHLLAIINDVLDVSKIEAGRMAIESIECSLPGILAEVESLLRPAALDKHLLFGVELDGAIPERIISDPTRLRQILVNLVGNAVKFTNAGSVALHVEIVGGEQRRLRIDVEDSGPGMNEAQASRLFRPFGQGDASIARQCGGTGLGLTISRRLASLMNGDVSLVRTAPGAGSVFRVELPLVVAPNSALTDSITRASVSRELEGRTPSISGRVLLAEDGPDNRRLIVHHLRQAGAEVDCAEDGATALAMIELAQRNGRPYDLLLTDIQMPNLDGHTLTRRLRRQGFELAVVALTAHAMTEDEQRCRDAGCDDYLSKPIDCQRLLKTCARWIGAGSTAAARRAA